MLAIDRHPGRDGGGVIGHERTPVRRRVGVDHERGKTHAGPQDDEREGAGEHRRAATARDERRNDAENAEDQQLAAHERAPSRRRRLEYDVEGKPER